jgi:hypothetical protein
MTKPRNVLDVELIDERRLGDDGGFLVLRRMRLRNRYDDGSVSAEYGCEYVERPVGLDAVAVALWYRGEDRRPWALLRAGLRPPVRFGRSPAVTAEPEALRPLAVTELVAGIIERGEVGREAIARRAAAECQEEAGFSVDPAGLVFLGPPVFTLPGVLPERVYLTAAEVDPSAGGHPGGDGSPMEDGPLLRFVPLDEAIASCLRGELEHATTEVALRRLRDWLEER